MKRGTPSHPKTLDLAAYLRLERWGAVGILEGLFHFVATYARRGDIGRMTDRQIATGVGWEGDPEQLVEGLVSAGWLDACPCHRLRLHDWPEHADQGVSQSILIKKQGFIECYTHGLSGQDPELKSGQGHAVKGTGKTEDGIPLKEKNPLVDRAALVAEGYELVKFIAPLEGLDPTEVARKATDFKGHSYVNLNNMSDDRLAHSVAKLREWARKLRGEPEPQAPQARAPDRKPTASEVTQDAVRRIEAEERDRRHGRQADIRERALPGGGTVGPGGDKGAH